MGQQQSTNDFGNYQILKKISEVQYLMKTKNKSDELQMRILSFSEEEDAINYLRMIEKRKKVKNAHLLQVIESKKIIQQANCSESYKIQIIIEYPFKSLQQQILQRKEPTRYFMEDQLWSILFSCCNALHSLYLNKLYHECLDTEQILIEKDGIIKLADPNIGVEVNKNYLSIMNEKLPARIPYISPELVNLVEDNNFYYYDKQKSDVFILAMIVLEAANLTPIPYYEPKTKKISLDLITQALQIFKRAYSPKLAQTLQKMLNFESKNRVNFQQVIQMIEEKTVFAEPTETSKQSSIDSQINYLKTNKTPMSVEPRPKKQPQMVSQKPIYDQFNPQNKNSLLPNKLDSEKPFDKIEIGNQTIKHTFNFSTPYQLLGSQTHSLIKPNIKKELSFFQSNPENKQFQVNTVAQNIFKAIDLKSRLASGNGVSVQQQGLNGLNQQNKKKAFNLASEKANEYIKQIQIQNNSGYQASVYDSKITEGIVSANGKFVIEKLEAGIYQGFKYEDKKNGIGRIYYNDGSYYEGQWKDDMIHGYGKLYFPNGALAFQGNWLCDQFNGYGKAINDRPVQTNDPISYKDLSKVADKWTQYEGEFKNDTRHGKGTFNFTNGDRFVGNFKYGVAEGEGTYYLFNGDLINGFWSNNQFIEPR